MYLGQPKAHFFSFPSKPLLTELSITNFKVSENLVVRWDILVRVARTYRRNKKAGLKITQ